MSLTERSHSNLPFLTLKSFHEFKGAQHYHDHVAADGGFLYFGTHRKSGAALFSCYKSQNCRVDPRPVSMTDVCKPFFVIVVPNRMRPLHILEVIQNALKLLVESKRPNLFRVRATTNGKTMMVVFPELVMEVNLLNVLGSCLNNKFNGEVIQTKDSVRYPGFYEFDESSGNWLEESVFEPMHGNIDESFYSEFNINSYQTPRTPLKDDVSAPSLFSMLESSLSLGSRYECFFSYTYISRRTFT